jgi:serine/threonine protein kinase
MSEFKERVLDKLPDSESQERIESLGTLRIRDFREAYPSLSIGRKLGKGGSHTVYKLDRRYGVGEGYRDDVVIKLLHLPRQFFSKTAKEMSIHAKLTDPMSGVIGVVPIIDYVSVISPETGDETIGSIQKEMKGGNFCDVGSTINDETERLNVLSRAMIDVCEGVQSMHDAGVVHGDLNPKNILFNERKSAVFIADFDVSYLKTEVRHLLELDKLEKKRPLSSHLPDILLTNDQRVQKSASNMEMEEVFRDLVQASAGDLIEIFGGTTEYLPPECVNTQRTDMTGVVVDMYSLGVILYEMRTGMVPIEANRSLGNPDVVFYYRDPVTIKDLLIEMEKPYRPHYLDKIAEVLVSANPESRLSVALDMGDGQDPQILPLVTPMDIANAIRVASKNAGVSLDEEKIKFLRKSNELRGVPKHED